MELKDIEAYRACPLRTESDEPVGEMDLTEEFRETLPADLSALLVSARETFWDPFFLIAGRELILRFDDGTDFVAEFNYDYNLPDPAEGQCAVFETLSYTLSLLRRIASLVPFLPEMNHESPRDDDCGSWIRIPFFQGTAEVPSPGRESKLWEVRKVILSCESGWEATAGPEGVLISRAADGDKAWGRRTELLIPYGCPRRHYLPLLTEKVQEIWSEIESLWSQGDAGAFALRRSTGSDTGQGTKIPAASGKPLQ